MSPTPFARLLGIAGRRALESVAPRRTFDDVILPPATRRALDIALSQVTQHDLIFNRWGSAEKVQELIDTWKSGGLGVAGPEATLSAFQLGQVDELIITGSPDTLKSVQELPQDAAPGDVQVITSNPGGAGDEGQLKLSDELITRAQ